MWAARRQRQQRVVHPNSPKDAPKDQNLPIPSDPKFSGMFHEINHPALGDPPLMETLSPKFPRIPQDSPGIKAHIRDAHAVSEEFLGGLEGHLHKDHPGHHDGTEDHVVFHHVVDVHSHGHFEDSLTWWLL